MARHTRTLQSQASYRKRGSTLLRAAAHALVPLLAIQGTTSTLSAFPDQPGLPPTEEVEPPTVVGGTAGRGRRSTRRARWFQNPLTTRNTPLNRTTEDTQRAVASETGASKLHPLRFLHKGKTSSAQHTPPQLQETTGISSSTPNMRQKIWNSLRGMRLTNRNRASHYKSATFPHLTPGERMKLITKGGSTVHRPTSLAHPDHNDLQNAENPQTLESCQYPLTDDPTPAFNSHLGNPISPPVRVRDPDTSGASNLATRFGAVRNAFTPLYPDLPRPSTDTPQL